MSRITEYPPLWQDGTAQIHTRIIAGHRCEWCGMAFYYGTNKAVFERNKDGKPVIGTVHHINGIKEDLSWQNLVYLCQRCHLRAQWTWLPDQSIPPAWLDMYGKPPAWIVKRGLVPEIRQLSLWGDE